MNENIKNQIIYKIVDLIQLNDTDIQSIQEMNDNDKMSIINIYIETMNNIIYFMENYL
jgi:hypothetical protein